MPKVINVGNVYDKTFDQVNHQGICRIENCPGHGVPQWHGVCRHHATAIYRSVRRDYEYVMEESPEALTRRDQVRAEMQAEAEARKATAEARAVVYYVRLGGRIKIGYTTQLRNRLASFRTTVERVELLATEPGDPRLERERHNQFGKHRIRNSELFREHPELMEHIAAIRSPQLDLSA